MDDDQLNSLIDASVKALFRECRLDVTLYEGAGRAGVRCVRNERPPSELLSTRALTPEEANELLLLARESSLLSGSHIGPLPNSVTRSYWFVSNE